MFAAAFGGDFEEASEQVMAVHDFTCDGMGLFVKHAAFFYLEQNEELGEQILPRKSS